MYSTVDVMFCDAAKATVVITANDRVVGGRSFRMKENVDRALQSTSNVHTVLVASRTARKAPMDPRRDYCLEEVCKTYQLVILHQKRTPQSFKLVYCMVLH